MIRFVERLDLYPRPGSDDSGCGDRRGQSASRTCLCAANIGISAIIDANGDVVARLDTGETGVIDASLPGARAPTPYARFGDWTILVLMVASWSLVYSFGLIRRRLNAEHSSMEEW